MTFKSFLFENPFFVDINDCETVEGVCENIFSSHFFRKTLVLNLFENTFFSDINECETVEGICENGRCVNSEGGFKCECPPGYVVSGAGIKCEDMRKERCYQRYVRGDGSLLYHYLYHLYQSKI